MLIQARAPRIHSRTTLLILSLSLCYCSYGVLVVPTPPNAAIYLDDMQVGTGETKLVLASNEVKHTLRVCGPEGYYCKQTTIGTTTPETLRVNLSKDPSYIETVDATNTVNQWFAIPVARKYDPPEAWQRLSSLIAQSINDFAIVDQQSLYLKTAWKKTGTQDNPIRIKSRIIASVEEPNPKNLIFRIQIESKRVNTQTHEETIYHRTFAHLLDVIPKAKHRLAH